MKENFVHVCFIIDESGSMYSKKEDVVGGFRSMLEEQKSKTQGDLSVSLYRFNSEVHKEYVGKDINDVSLDFNYSPNGLTALFDGVGIAIDEIGKWLDGMNEDDKPSLNLVVVMTDGMENASKEYKADQVKEMIKHQEEKYNWKFIYMGADVTDSKDADSLGFKTKLYTTKDKWDDNYQLINCAVDAYRTGLTAKSVCSYLSDEANRITEQYNKENNLNLSSI